MIATVFLQASLVRLFLVITDMSEADVSDIENAVGLNHKELIESQGQGLI